MKLKMIALLSSSLGVVTAIGVHFVGERLLAHHSGNHGIQNQDIAEMMYADPTSPVILKVDPQMRGPAFDRGPLNPDRPITGPYRGPTQSSAFLRLIKTGERTTANDPVWQLQLVKGDQVLSTLNAVTGRADRQQLNRHTSGNKSPLPQGTYRVDRREIVRESFSDPELGSGYWVPITPMFATGRSTLGFHHDPSWGKKNGESGTSGCIGLRTAEDTMTLVDWIKHFNVHKLVVVS
jgi:lipoprotein-anchoring transpeptidase ErfK/SrfK